MPILVEVAPEVAQAEQAELCREIVAHLQRELNFTSAVAGSVRHPRLRKEDQTRGAELSGETLDG